MHTDALSDPLHDLLDPADPDRLADLEAAAALALLLPPAPARGGLRARLFASVDHLERFSSFAPRLGELLDIPANDARLALHAFEHPQEMPPAPIPGMRCVPLPLGPRVSNGSAILAAFDPGAGVPLHRHFGEEHVLVFQGAFETDDGRVIRAGEELRSTPGSSHAIALILPGEPCLCAIINDNNIEFLA